MNRDTRKKGKINCEENNIHDGAALSLDRRCDGATG
jgi:hypothetical protein